MQDELESFKAHVSIADVAVNQYFYAVDVKESCRSSTVLRSESGDKLVVMKHKVHGHDTYFGRHPADKGSVVDFVNFRVTSNDARLIPVRQLLRQYVPGAKKPAARKVSLQTIMKMAPVFIEKDLEQISEYINTLNEYSGTYLTQDRGISKETMERFVVGHGEYGNAVFPHLTYAREVCGYEFKNRPLSSSTKSFTGFSEGGMKSLFRSYSFTGDQEAMTSRIVIAESAIDAMSHAQLFPQENTIYASTAGTNLTAEQQEHLRALFAEHSTATLVLAMDNDEFNKRGELQAFDDRPGEKMAKLVASLAPLGMHFERHTPTLKDWNADLLAMRAP